MCGVHRNLPPLPVSSAAFIYDDALGIVAFLADRRPSRARAVLERLAALQAPDGSLAFSYDVLLGRVFEDYRRTGAMAWVGYAAVMYQRQTGEPTYEPFARRIADHLLQLQVTEANGYPANDPRLGSILGGRGRYDENYDYADDPIAWASTEHNIDAYFFLRDLAEEVADSDPDELRYAEAASQVKTSLLVHHWNASEGRFNQGVGDTSHALDVASWGGLFLLAIGDEARAQQSLSYLQRFSVVDAPLTKSTSLDSFNQTFELASGVDGYRPYANSPEGYEGSPGVVWAEGTWGAILFKLRMGIDVTSDLQEMSRLQSADPDGGFVQVTRGARSLPWEFHVWPSVGGTAWAAIVSADASLLWGPDDGGTEQSGPGEQDDDPAGLPVAQVSSHLSTFCDLKPGTVSITLISEDQNGEFVTTEWAAGGANAYCSGYYGPEVYSTMRTCIQREYVVFDNPGYRTEWRKEGCTRPQTVFGADVLHTSQFLRVRCKGGQDRFQVWTKLVVDNPHAINKHAKKIKRGPRRRLDC